MSDQSPQSAIWDALRGGLVTRALGLVAELRIARALEAGPRPVSELAAETGADADTLHRLLRALASDGIFAEEEPGVLADPWILFAGQQGHGIADGPDGAAEHQ